MWQLQGLGKSVYERLEWPSFRGHSGLHAKKQLQSFALLRASTMVKRLGAIDYWLNLGFPRLARRILGITFKLSEGNSLPMMSKVSWAIISDFSSTQSEVYVESGLKRVWMKDYSLPGVNNGIRIVSNPFAVCQYIPSELTSSTKVSRSC